MIQIDPYEVGGVVDHAGVYQAISDLIRAHGPALPDVTYGALSAFYPSNVVRCTQAVEALYAARAAIPDEGKLVCARLAATMADPANAWGMIGATDRGPRMILALRRDLGDAVDQAEADDPKPDGALVPPTV